MAEPPAKRPRRLEPGTDAKSASDRSEKVKRLRDDETNGHHGDQQRSKERSERKKERNRDRREARHGMERDRSRERDDRARRNDKVADRGHRGGGRRDEQNARSRSPPREHRNGNVRTRTPPRGPRIDRDQVRDRARPVLPMSKHRTSDTAGPSQPSSRIPPAKWRRHPTNEMDAEDAEEEQQLKIMMGFGSFMTTKETKVPGNSRNYAVLKEKKTEYRQYMNRAGGFNRPLSPG